MNIINQLFQFFHGIYMLKTFRDGPEYIHLRGCAPSVNIHMPPPLQVFNMYIP